MTDGHRPDPYWIPSPEYERILAAVPILCVDLLPLRDEGNRVGLILRDTYDDKQGWCMIGGAVRRTEDLKAALDRHLKSTLGERVRWEALPPEPQAVVEYLPDADPVEPHDPRKHAVALTYAAVLVGDPHPQDEAIDFRWFDRAELADVAFGFGQGPAVARVLKNRN